MRNGVSPRPSLGLCLVLSTGLLWACRTDTSSGDVGASVQAPVARPQAAADEPSTLNEVEHSPVTAQPAKEGEPTLAGTAKPELEDDNPTAGDRVAEGPAAELEPAPAEPVTIEPRKVLILGDSLAATGFGALLERSLDAHPHVNCARKGKSASGLARPDFFDWIAEGKRQVERHEPDLVVVIMGGNDGQDLTHKRRKQGRRVLWKHENWEAGYRERMDKFLAEVGAPQRKVLWLGLPTMGLRSLERKLTLIRKIQREAVEVAGGTYLETAGYVTDDDGKVLSHAKVGERRKPQKIRADDKIHFTMSGSRYFADKIYPEVLKNLGLEDPPQ